MSVESTIDPNRLIGDTVYNPESVKPLRESDCKIAIPLPNFFIVGGAKCGSTTLTSVLMSHPDCCHSVPKETNFFTLNFDQGWDWYRGTFAHYDGEPVIGEGSVSYTGFPFRKNVVGLLHDCNPAAKIVYIVRHPFHKLVSGWKMALTGPGYLAHESALRGFEDYVLHEETRHSDRVPWENPTHGWDAAMPSRENMTRVWLDALHFQGHVDHFERHFPRAQIMVIFLEDWKADSLSVARRLCVFLGLDPDRLPPPSNDGVNKAKQRKRTLPIYKFVADSKLLAPIRHLFPARWRRPIRKAWYSSRFGSRQIVYPELQMRDAFRTELLRYLALKSRSFLRSQGKPDSFWDFADPQ